MRPRRVFPLLLVLLPALIALRFPGVSDSLRLAALELSRPVYETVERATDRVFAGGRALAELATARRDNERLRRELLEARTETSHAKEVEKENERLRKLLDLRELLGVRGRAARVIGRSPSQWFRLIVLDQGAKHGLSKRDVLLAAGGLAGRVFEVGPFSAKAVLLTDPEFRAGAIGQDSRDMGVVAGTGGVRLKVQYLPLETKLAVGEVVLTSGLGGIFPKGLPIGRVREVGVAANALESVAWVDPFCDVDHLEEVLCIPSLEAP